MIFLNLLLFKKFMICCICLEHNCNVFTSCNHNFCLDCIDKIKTTNNLKTCPLCRHVIKIDHIGVSTRNQKNIVSEINFNSFMFNFIKKINSTKNIQERINEMCIMCNYILNNKEILLKRKKFTNMIYNKLKKFVNHNDSTTNKLNKYIIILQELMY